VVAKRKAPVQTEAMRRATTARAVISGSGLHSVLRLGDSQKNKLAPV
jgi:hypothetical protein